MCIWYHINQFGGVVRSAFVIDPIRRRKIMLSINLDDVMQVLTNVRGYLIAFGVVALLAIVVMIALRKLPKA